MKKKMRENFAKKMSVLLLAMAIVLTLGGCGASSKNFEAAADSAAPEEEFKAEYEVTEEAVADEAWDDSAESGMMDTAAGAASDEAWDDSVESDMMDTAADTGEAQAEIIQSNEKIIYTYNYSVETKQFDTFMDAVQKRISEYGGYIESSETNGNMEMNIRRYANMVIRIPADKMHSFLNMVKENSNVTYSSSSTENVTLSYVDMQSHIKALKTEQETLMGILEKAEKLEDIIALQNQLTNIRYELESYESQLRVYDNRINYSTLYLDINEVERETNVATELTYGEEIRQGLSDTMYSIRQGLRDFSIWFIVNLPILFIWAVVLVILFLIVRKILKLWAKKAGRRKSARNGSKGQAVNGGVWSAQTEEKQETSEETGEKQE